MPGRIPLLAFVFIAGFVTTVGGVVSTNKQIRRYLGMPKYVGVVPDQVRAAVFDYIPAGSSRDRVERALLARHIGAEKDSACAPASGRAELTCRLGIDHHAWELLRETFTVRFSFDSSGTLRNVSVRSGFYWLWQESARTPKNSSL